MLLNEKSIPVEWHRYANWNEQNKIINTRNREMRFLISIPMDSCLLSNSAPDIIKNMGTATLTIKLKHRRWKLSPTGNLRGS